MTAPTSTSVLDSYAPMGPIDELHGPGGEIREHWRYVAGVLDQLGPSELQRRRSDLVHLLDADGATYHNVENDRSQRWRLDPVPLLITSNEWQRVEAGLIQRAVLLDLVLTDLYGPRELLRRGVIPPEIIFDHPGFIRPADGIHLPGHHQLLLYAADLGRGADGQLHVLSDRTQSPSGYGYALENRTVLSRVFPSLHRAAQVHRVAPFFRSLRSALQELGSATSDDPRIVVLSPGSRTETAYEQAAIAATLGFDLVEAEDLTMRDGRVFLRALGRLEPVDVVLRRVDAEWSDPLALRPDSHLGVAGLVEATRRGSVAVVNPMGAGVLENPALAAFLPAAAEALLGTELQLPSAPTYWCGDPVQRSHVLSRLDELVVKPIGRGPGPLSVFPNVLAGDGRDDLRRQIEAHPHRWVGQERLPLGTAPTFDRNTLVPRRTVLRAFAVSREESYAVMAGGLTRVAAADDDRRITNQAGAWSKDTWVLASEPETMSEMWLRSGPTVSPAESTSMSSRAAENLFWLGRYLERAEMAVRLLRAVDDRRTEFSMRQVPAGDQTLGVLLAALTEVTGTQPGFVGPGGEDRRANPDTELFSVVCDRFRTGSLAHTIGHLESAAGNVRDQLSIDTWVLISSMVDQLNRLADAEYERRDVVQGMLGEILQSLLALQGLVNESMVRDAGWYFLDVGRRMERSLQLARLLTHTMVPVHDESTSALLSETTLVVAESIITYRRRYRSRAQIETILDLLVADAGNPRSLRFQIDRLNEAVTVLPGAGRGRLTEEERRVLELSTTMRVAETGKLAAVDGGSRPDLDAFLITVILQLRGAAEAIEQRNFTHLEPQRSLGASFGSSLSGVSV